MWETIVKFLELVGLSLEITFCIGMMARFFLDRSKISFERIVFYGGGTFIATLFLWFSGLDADTIEVFTYGLWGFMLVLFLYTGKIFYKTWAICVSLLMMWVAIGLLDLIVGILFMKILGFSLEQMAIVDEYFWFPEMVGAVVMAYLFKLMPFYYKDKTCYKRMPILKKVIVLILLMGGKTIAQTSILAIDGGSEYVTKGIETFLWIYAGLIVSLLLILRSYKNVHTTYTNREALLVKSFSKKHIKTMQQLDKLDKSNQRTKQMIYNQVSDLAKIASEAGLEKIRIHAQQLASAVEPMNQEFLLTGHSVLDAVLKEKYIAAEERGIKLFNKISIPDHIALSSIDLSIIVGQAIDYAMRKCEGVEAEKSIKIEGVWYKGYIILKVWYSTQSEESESECHEQELEIIRRCIAKYEGHFKKSVELHRSQLEFSFNAK